MVFSHEAPAPRRDLKQTSKFTLSFSSTSQLRNFQIMVWELWLPKVWVLCPSASLTLSCYLLKSVPWSLFVIHPVLWGFHGHCRSLYVPLRVSDSPCSAAQPKILGLEQNPPQQDRG